MFTYTSILTRSPQLCFIFWFIECSICSMPLICFSPLRIPTTSMFDLLSFSLFISFWFKKLSSFSLSISLQVWSVAFTCSCTLSSFAFIYGLISSFWFLFSIEFCHPLSFSNSALCVLCVCVFYHFKNYINFETLHYNFYLFCGHVFLACFPCLLRCYSSYSIFLLIILYGIWPLLFSFLVLCEIRFLRT